MSPQPLPILRLRRVTRIVQQVDTSHLGHCLCTGFGPWTLPEHKTKWHRSSPKTTILGRLGLSDWSLNFGLYLPKEQFWIDSNTSSDWFLNFGLYLWKRTNLGRFGYSDWFLRFCLLAWSCFAVLSIPPVLMAVNRDQKVRELWNSRIATSACAGVPPAAAATRSCRLISCLPSVAVNRNFSSFRTSFRGKIESSNLIMIISQTDETVSRDLLCWRFCRFKFCRLIIDITAGIPGSSLLALLLLQILSPTMEEGSCVTIPHPAIRESRSNMPGFEGRKVGWP